jgi:2'-5' RNA ligase
MNRFFISLIPPSYIQEYTNEIKQHFAIHYASYGAQNSPPHITLQPPFVYQSAKVTLMETAISKFAQQQQPVPIILNGFAAFPQHVIYIDVLKSPELLLLQSNLIAYMKDELGIFDPKSHNRPFVPHMTVAFRDLTPENFQAAWPEFQQRQLYFEFTATDLSLLQHDGQRWNVKQDFPFG